MKGPETRLRRKIMEALKVKYPQGYFRHIHGNAFQTVGIPDIYACVNGLFFGLEVKRPGRERRATPAQIMEIRRIERAGGTAAVVTSPQEAIDLIDGELNAQSDI